MEVPLKIMSSKRLGRAQIVKGIKTLTGTEYIASLFVRQCSKRDMKRCSCGARHVPTKGCPRQYGQTKLNPVKDCPSAVGAVLEW